MRSRFFGVVLAALSLVAGSAASQEATPRVIPIWPEGVPNAQPKGGVERIENDRVYNVQNPTLTYFPAPVATANGTVVIVCPGGGYVRLAVSNEGSGFTKVLNQLGVSAFVLKSRLVEYGQPAPLQDVLRAVRLVRSRAKEFGIDPARIGVMGSSAGGHLAASAGTLYDAPEGRTGNREFDSISGRPDFLALLYPVITMKPPFAHAGSRRALLGDRPTDAVIDRWSMELQVNSQTPPAFIVHTEEDTSVPLENSVMFFQALRKYRIDAELHLYEKGPHGFGTRGDLGPTSEWPKRLEDWMRSHGWLEKSTTR